MKIVNPWIIKVNKVSLETRDESDFGSKIKLYWSINEEDLQFCCRFHNSENLKLELPQINGFLFQAKR